MIKLCQLRVLFFICLQCYEVDTLKKCHLRSSPIFCEFYVALITPNTQHRTFHGRILGETDSFFVSLKVN